jgi:hypothetical protein
MVETLTELLSHQTDNEQMKFRELGVVESQGTQIVQLSPNDIFGHIDQIQCREIIAGAQQRSNLKVSLFDERQGFQALEKFTLILSLSK